MTPGIAIFRKSDGQMRYLAAADFRPSDPADGWTPLPAGYNEALYRWDAASRTMVLNLEAVKADALAAIDQERERRQMTMLTSGGAKKYVYNRKRDEARDYRSLSGTVLVALLAITGLTQRRERFPYAQAEAEARGMTLTQVIETYEAGIRAADAAMKEIEATAIKAKAAVRAATSASQAQSLATSMNWPTTA